MAETIGRGSTLGRYLVIGTLGRGGMGTVFEGYDEALGRIIAIKLLNAETNSRQAERLRREAQAMAKISHPNVVHVYEVGCEHGQWFIAMERVVGQTLRQWQADQHDWRACVEAYLQAGQGLAAAHAAGLVHRDFKPDNCIIDARGRVRVLDFGLVTDTLVASHASGHAAAEDSCAGAEGVAGMTDTGVLLGTVAYMSPEQLDGQPAKASSDQFSFCVSLHEALYGQRPFAGSSVAALAEAIADARVRAAPAGRGVPAAVRAVLLRGLAADPSGRWPSVVALLDALRRVAMPRRRRYAIAGLTAGLVALGGGVAFGQYAQVKDRCTGAKAQLEGIWDEVRRREVAEAIVGTGRSFAADTLLRVEAQLDDYAARWVEQRTAACEATRVTEEQTEDDMGRRMTCFRHRKVALRAAVDVLVDADAEVVEHANKLVGGLPDLARCDDLEALRADVPPPADLRVAREVERIREELAENSASRRAGRYVAALQDIEAIAPRAQALGYPPLVAEVSGRTGELLDMNGRYDEAEEVLREGYRLAMAERHDEVARETARRLTWVVGVRQARHAEGLVWGEVALAQATRTGGDPLRRVIALQDIGSILADKGELDAALARMQQALTLLDEASGDQDRRRGTLLDRIAIVLARQGQLTEARQHQQRALELVERSFGPRHPHVASVLNNTSVVLRMQGKYDEALAEQTRALTIFEQAWGEEHPMVAAVLDNIGGAYAMKGELVKAREHFERGLAIRERTLSADHPDLAKSLNNVGSVVSDLGEHAGALAYYQRSLAIGERTHGPTHVDLASTLTNIGVLLVDSGKPEEAVAPLERARAIWEQTLGEDHPDVAKALVGLARAMRHTGQLDAARRHAQRALTLREAAEVSPAELALARFELARVLGSIAGQRTRARVLAQQARDSYAQQGPGRVDDVANVDRWLAAHP